MFNDSKFLFHSAVNSNALNVTDKNGNNPLSNLAASGARINPRGELRA